MVWSAARKIKGVRKRLLLHSGLVVVVGLIVVRDVFQRNPNPNTKGILESAYDAPIQTTDQGGPIATAALQKPTANDKNNTEETDNDCCKLFCTRPSKTQCCLPCNDEASETEREFLMTMLEGLTVHIDSLHRKSHQWLRDRSWTENSHIGNRLNQGPFYFEWARAKIKKALQVNNTSETRICEIGYNGGHSAAVFLAATPRATTVTAFDLQQYEYSQTGLEYVQKLFPGRLEMIIGSSFDTVPAFAKQHGRVCDLFSVDGDHSLTGSEKDVWHAIEATKIGGWLIVDDMTVAPRRSLDKAIANSGGALGNMHCLDDVPESVSRKDRYDNTDTFDMKVGWCWVQVVKEPDLTRARLIGAFSS